MPSEGTTEPRSTENLGSAFRTTLWTEVLQAGDTSSPEAAAALERLCRTYWYPLYAFIRRAGHDVHAAQDLTQAFFSKLLEQRALTAADPEKGKFRSFLLARLKHFLANERTYHHRQKRGGGQATFSLDEVLAEGRYGQEPRCDDTPERLYERRWAQTLLDEVMSKLAGEYEAAGQSDRFAGLKPYLVDASDAENSYGAAAARLGLTESAVKSAVFRLRQRYRELFRGEIGSTVATSAEIDAEIRYLLNVMRS